MSRATSQKRKRADRVRNLIQEARNITALCKALIRARRMGLLKFPWDQPDT